jgi:hypothetical protein
MERRLRFAATIPVAVAEPHGELRSVGVIPNPPESIRKLLKELGEPEQRRVCYEAIPTREYQSNHPSRKLPRPPSVLLRNHSKINLTCPHLALISPSVISRLYNHQPIPHA